MLPVAVCALAVVGLLAARRREARTVAALLKLLAASAFVWAGIHWGATSTAYGRTLLAGLLLCWLGDALLLPAGRTVWFRLGIGAFLLGHLAYTTAFVQLGVAPAVSAVALASLLPASIGVLRWLRPHVPRALRAPVAAYVVVISLMIVIAVGGAWTSGRPAVLVGALGFAVSDLSVARERFVAPAASNSTWGLPLYFGAQLLLASTVTQGGG